jgi:hypothetical protein
MRKWRKKASVRPYSEEYFVVAALILRDMGCNNSAEVVLWGPLLPPNARMLEVKRLCFPVLAVKEPLNIQQQVLSMRGRP